MFRRFSIYLTTLFLVCLLSALFVTAQPMSFAARKEFPTLGRQPESAAAGDFNRDGRMDLIAANSRSATGVPAHLRMLFGNGDGTFQPAGSILTGGDPTDVHADDLNNDGKLDLAVVNFNSSGSGTVSILLGNDNGTFQSPLVFASGIFSRFLAISDHNGDGKKDLAVLNVGAPPRFDSQNNVSIFFGSGNGTFQAGVSFAVGPQPLGMAVSDFNNDGKADIAVKFGGEADINGGISMLMGSGDGTFKTAPVIRSVISPYSILAGDFNNDGKADLAVPGGGGFTGHSVSILSGLGYGMFDPPVSYPIGDFSLGLTQNDLNGDGKIDLAVVNKNSFDISVLFGNGNGTFQPSVDYFAGRDPVYIVTSDFNGDSLPDLATINEASNSVSVLLNKGSGSFMNETNFAAGTLETNYLALTDLNSDCKLDVVTANNTNNISVLLGNGNGTLQAPMTFGAGVQPFRLTVGDFNNDRKPDVAVANSGVPFSDPGSVSVLLGNGNGTFQPAIDILTADAPTSVAIADLNLDGKADFAVTNFRSNSVSVRLGNGNGTFGPAPTLDFPALSGLTSVVKGDFNHDGKPDLAVGSQFQSLIAVFSGNGDGTFQRGTDVVFPITRSIGSLKTLDFDNDGKLDLVSSGHIVLRGNGDGTFQLFPDVEVTGSTDVFPADLNGDNRPDLAFANGFAMRIEVVAGNGDGTFQPAIMYGSGGLPQALAAGDFNGDGKPEVVSTNSQSASAVSDNISLLFNKKLLWKARLPKCPASGL